MDKSTSTGVMFKVTNAILRILLNTVFYIAIIWCVVTAGKYIYDFSYQVFGSVSVSSEPGTDIEFTIDPGEATMNIANRLEFNGLIVNKNSFYLKAKIHNYKIFPGTYVLNTSMDYEDILEVIIDQDNSIVKEEAVTKPNDNKGDQKKEETQGKSETAVPEVP